jgi:hypothetical protein
MRRIFAVEKYMRILFLDDKSTEKTIKAPASACTYAV